MGQGMRLGMSWGMVGKKSYTCSDFWSKWQLTHSTLCLNVIII